MHIVAHEARTGHAIGMADRNAAAMHVQTLRIGMTRLPDESTILRFRHILETHGLAAQMLALVNEIPSEKGLMLKAGSAVDAHPISGAP
jgi:IS5 family transposase